MLNQMVLLVPLILHTFAAFSLCHLIYLQLRHDPLGRRSWGGWAWRAVTLSFAAYFLSYLVGYLLFVFSYGHQSAGTPATRIAFLLSYQTIGVLIMQLFYSVERERLPPHWLWRAVLGSAWAGSLALLAVIFAARAGAPLLPGIRESLHSFSEAILAFAMFFSCVIVVLARRPSDSKFKRRQRRWYVVLVAVVLFYLVLQTVRAWPWFDLFVLRFLPLVFVFITVYYGERLVFLDVFVSEDCSSLRCWRRSPRVLP